MGRTTRQFHDPHRRGVMRSLALVDLIVEADRRFIADLLDMFTQPENSRIAAACRSGSFLLRYRFDGRAVLFPSTESAKTIRPLGLRPRQRCRECGCTDWNACLDTRTGQGCHWVERDLCSVCAHKPALKRKAKKPCKAR